MFAQSVVRGFWGLLWLALVLPAHASDDETLRRLTGMQQQMDALNQRVTTLETQSQGSAILSLQSQIDALKGELARMHGLMDEQAHELATAEKRQTDLYQDLDTRLRALPRNDAANSATTDANAAPASNVTVPNQAQASPDSNSQQTQAYQTALTQFKQGDYKGAIAGFKTFIKTWPNDPMAASAQYWIGNAFFSLKDFRNAAQAQQKLISSYPKSPKVPDALLNLSSAQVEQGDLEGARKTLQSLIKRYPDSSAAVLGKKRLLLLQGA